MDLVLEWKIGDDTEREIINDTNFLPPVGTIMTVERKEPFKTNIESSRTLLKVGKYEWNVKFGRLQARTKCEVIKSEYQNQKT